MEWLRELLTDVFRTAPGPIIAKFTNLWKVVHIQGGDYQETIQELHRRAGNLVQIGPKEYSLSDHTQFASISQLQLASCPVHEAASKSLNQAPDMANVFRQEKQIEKCGQKLLERLTEKIDTEEPVDISELVVRYAYELMLITTTHQSAGYLEKNVDALQVGAALKEWKFSAILYGTYLRFHPYIESILKFLKGDESLLRQPCPSRSDSANASPAIDIPDVRPQTPHHFGDTVEARIALCLAGTDPLVQLLVLALERIYSDMDLLEQLRYEIKESDLWQPPRIKQILRMKRKLRLLFGTLNECLRLRPPRGLSRSYVSPKGGVMVEGKLIPEASIITLDPNLALSDPNLIGRDAHMFNPKRWLNSKLAQELETHSLLVQDSFQTIITSKLLIQLLPSIDIVMSRRNIPSNINTTVAQSLKAPVNTPVSPLGNGKAYGVANDPKRSNKNNFNKANANKKYNKTNNGNGNFNKFNNGNRNNNFNNRKSFNNAKTTPVPTTTPNTVKLNPGTARWNLFAKEQVERDAYLKSAEGYAETCKKYAGIKAKTESDPNPMKKNRTVIITGVIDDGWIGRRTKLRTEVYDADNNLVSRVIHYNGPLKDDPEPANKDLKPVVAGPVRNTLVTTEAAAATTEQAVAEQVAATTFNAARIPLDFC